MKISGRHLLLLLWDSLKHTNVHHQRGCKSPDWVTNAVGSNVTEFFDALWKCQMPSKHYNNYNKARTIHTGTKWY